jgi:hypothetical protein
MSFSFGRMTVLSTVGEDGGAHIDPELRASYAALVKANSLGRMGAEPGQEMRPLLNIALTSTRQIAHELLRTLERELPRLVGTTPTDAPTSIADETPAT